MANSRKDKKRKKKKQLDFVFSDKHVEFFQDISAERENDLIKYYVENEFSEAADNFESKRSFFVARTGMGKTAILEKIRQKTNKDWILSVDPEEFAFTIMEKSSILTNLSIHGVNLDLFYKTMWKYIFISEILKRRFGSDKKSWLQRKLVEFRGNVAQKKAYEFLLKYEEIGRGLSFSGQIKQIIERLEVKIKAKFGEGSIELNTSQKLPAQSKDKIHDALKEFEFTDLNYFLSVLDEDVIGGRSYYILVDDLDKHWIQNQVGVNFTRCLFETIFDINSSKRLRIIVSLRTNLFKQLKFHQTEKFKPYIQHISWSDQQLKKIIESRLQAICNVSQSDIWDYIFPKTMILDQQKSLTILVFIMRRTSRKPRDTLLFISYMLQYSLGKSKITAEAIRSAELEYSKDRLDSLFDEWENPYVNLSFIRNFFLQKNYRLSFEQLKSVLEDIIQDVLVREEANNLEGLEWLIEGQIINKETVNFTELFRLLYRIGFLGWRPTPGSNIQFSYVKGFEEADNIFSEQSIFFINPCYYRALSVSFNKA